MTKTHLSYLISYQLQACAVSRLAPACAFPLLTIRHTDNTLSLALVRCAVFGTNPRILTYSIECVHSPRRPSIVSLPHSTTARRQTQGRRPRKDYHRWRLCRWWSLACSAVPHSRLGTAGTRRRCESRCQVMGSTPELTLYPICRRSYLAVV